VGNRPTSGPLEITKTTGGLTMKGAMLWLLGIPIPVIIALYLFHVI
jgi:hypothetical protein